MAALINAVPGLKSFLQDQTKEQAGLIWNFKGDFEEMKKTLDMIKSALRDAERRYIQDETFRLWYAELRGACYDIQDMLDRYMLECGQQLPCDTTDPKSVWSKLSCETCLHSLVHYAKVLFQNLVLANDMKKMRNNLKKIEELKNRFKAQEYMGLDWKNISNNRQTCSSVEAGILGREEDQRAIVDLILGNENTDPLFVIPILGMCGLGKTILAKLIFNDERLRDKKRFDLHAWAHVSKEFNLVDVGSRLIESITKSDFISEDLELINLELQMQVSGKRCFIVLDDFWNIDLDDGWGKLKTILEGSLKGSVIVVTTRIRKTAEIMATDVPYYLKTLSEETCIKLFQRKAFKSTEEMNEYPNLVGIGKDIVKKCGGLALAANALGGMLRSDRNERRWSSVRDRLMMELDEDDTPLEKKTMSSLKVSYGFMPPELKLCFAYCSIFPEGHRIDINKLVQHWISLNFVRQTHEATLALEGHAYLKDLITMTFLQECEKSPLETQDEVVMNDLMHDLARFVAKDHDIKVITDKEDTESRSAVSYRYISSYGKKKPSKFDEHVQQNGKVRAIYLKGDQMTLNDSSFSQFTCLRVLEVEDYNACLPESIGKLKQLRYLSAYDLKMPLPESICSLQNLLYLRLVNISNLKELPELIGNLQSLQYLELSYCYDLGTLPESICNLSNLLHLKVFYCTSICKLPEGLGDLKRMQYIDLLDCCNLETLPESICNLSNLLHLNLARCYHLEKLPEGLGDLQSLQYLELSDCDDLETLPESICRLSNLLHLKVSWCPSILELPEDLGDLKSLRYLELSQCGDLQTLPESICNLSNLLHLNLAHCSGFEKLPEGLGNLRSLQHLDMSYCNFETLPKSIRNLVHLETLIAGRVDQVEDLAESLIPLTSLKQFSVSLTTSSSSTIKMLTKIETLELELDLTIEVEENGCNIVILQNLNMLHGQLTIRDLERVKDPRDAEKANLIEKHKLKWLELIWYREWDEEVEDYESGDEDNFVAASVFQGLQPSLELETITVSGYRGRQWPIWMIDNHYYKLQRLHLTNIENIAHFLLPIGRLQHLKSLTLAKMANLSKITREIFGENEVELFPSLDRLYLFDAEILEEVCLTLFSRLGNFEVYNCPCLSRVEPSSSVVSLKFTYYKDLATLPDWVGDLPNLTFLTILICPKMESLPNNIYQLTHLELLYIWGCNQALKEEVASSLQWPNTLTYNEENLFVERDDS